MELLAIETRALHTLGNRSLDWVLLVDFLDIFKEPCFIEPFVSPLFLCFYFIDLSAFIFIS